MSNNFEEAIHQGFSRSDMAQEVSDTTERMEELGCFHCVHGRQCSPSCARIIDDEETFKTCHFFKEGGNT